MPDEPERGWLLLDYKEPVRHWLREFSPPLPVIVKVREWLRTREVNPLDGIRYVPGFDDYMFGVVPGTLGEDGRVVTCTFWVDRDNSFIRLDMISTASWPV